MPDPMIPTTRRRLVVACVAVFILIVSLLGLWAANRSSKMANGGLPHKDQVTFRLKWLIYSGFTPHFVALEKGYYDAQGLSVRIEPGGPGIDPLKLVVAGEADVGLASYDQILLARENGLPLVAIGEDTTKSGVGFLSLSTSGIKRPQDFIGRKVGIMPGTDKGTMYEAMMARLRVDRSRVEEIPVQFNLSVLLNGTVEVFPAFITNQPILARAQGFDVNVIDPADYGIVPGGNVFFTSEATLKTRRDVLLRFLRAELKAISDARDLNDGEAVDCVLKHNNQLQRTTEIDIWKATKTMLLPTDRATVGLMARAKWEHTAAIFRDSKMLKQEPKLDQCYTNDLVELIHRNGP